MGERRTIGQILTSVGRISDDDVATALEYQRDHGGFFGEALLACGLVSAEELEWGLASQFDLPYVFPEADAVDLEAAALVTLDWALSNLTLPIMKTDTTLTVVIDSPLKAEPVDELRSLTHLDVELALAAPSAIRELIRGVHARAIALDEERTAPLSLENTFDVVDEAQAGRWGISVRGGRAYAWWDDHGTTRRAALTGDWQAALERILVPPPSQMPAGAMRSGWDAEVDRAGLAVPVEVRCLADEFGREYVFRPRVTESALEARFPPPADGIVSEIRLLARSGTARLAVTTDPPELGNEILPHLPELILDPSWRSIYVTAEDQPRAEEAFSLTVPADPETWPDEIDALRAFHFDVVAVDLSGGDRAWTSTALDIAAVAFLLWHDRDLGAAYEAGVRWHLSIARDEDGGLSWSLQPLRA